MKMITAIVNKADADMVCNALAEAGFAFTKMATTGGFLRSGNTTLLMGTEDDKVATALEIIHQHCHKRTVNMPVHTVQMFLDIRIRTLTQQHWHSRRKETVQR